MKYGVKIFVSGDFCPSGSTEPLSIQKAESVFGDMLSFIRESDLSITNLECPLTLNNEPIAKTGPSFKVSPEIAKVLYRSNFHLVTLANNHILDYGIKGLEDTINACKDSQINYVGAGLNLKQAKQTYYTEIKGKNIAVINFCENEFSCATSRQGGANPMDIIENSRSIKDAKKNVDYVLVIIHGGNEYYPYPSPRVVKQYRYYAEQGASAIISHHTHCVGGYEVYNNVPIFYGVGNFLFYKENAPACWYKGYAVQLNFDDKLEFSIIPYTQCLKAQEIRLITGEEKNKFMNRIEDISGPIRNETLLQKKWDEYIKEQKGNYLSALLMRNRYLAGVLRRLHLSDLVFNRQKLRVLQNLIRCESHRDICISILETKLKDK